MFTPTVTISTSSELDLPNILVLPTALVDQPVENWQALVTQTFQPLAYADTLEWDWVNSELGSITVEVFRDLVGRLSFGVGPTSRRLVVVLAADLAPAQAQNALLKSLEEPPARTTLILAVTNPTNLLPTILSRCRIKYLTLDSKTSADLLDSDLSADLETLFQFGQNPSTITHSQLIQLASRYKDRISAKKLLQHWLEKLLETPTALSLSQLKLAQTTLTSLSQLDQNLSPSLVLEELWFNFSDKPA